MRSLSARGVGLMIAGGVLLATGTTSCASSGDPAAARYCAVMSDTIGLYLGNPVTQMGYSIGTVDTIEPQGAEVKVGFTITRDRAVPMDVKAVIRSPSILADRSLELVGNYVGGAKLSPGECIPRSRSFTPMSISGVIGSATDFVNEVSPEGSDDLGKALAAVDQTTQGTGTGASDLLTRSSNLLDNPDQTIADLGEITSNLAELTTMLRENRAPLKSIIQDTAIVAPDIVKAVVGASDLAHPLPELIQLINDLELELGPEVQLALDTVSESVRILSPHYKGIANLLNPIPRFISGLNGEPPGGVAGGLAKHINGHLFNLLPWRPPLFRIPTPNGLLACGLMNSSMPGSCADVGGRPYAVDVALLQYVLTEAQRR